MSTAIYGPSYSAGKGYNNISDFTNAKARSISSSKTIKMCSLYFAQIAFKVSVM